MDTDKNQNQNMKDEYCEGTCEGPSDCEEYCDYCGGRCEGVHCVIEAYKEEEKEIQLLVNIILSKKEKIVNEIIKRITDKYRLCKS